MEVELLAITPNAERVIELAGRTCYMSQSRTTNQSASKFIRMLITKGHHSVLEHASAAFRVTGVSRVLTHQLVRHRLCSFSQKSQRYVEEGRPEFIVPPSIDPHTEAHACFEESVSTAQRAYEKLLELGVPREDARFVMPNATPSEIVVSANLRELRHVILTRGARQAQWEVRQMAMKMLRIMKEEVPDVFFDLSINERGYVEQSTAASPA